MSWHKKVLAKNKKDIITKTMFIIVFALATLLWHFVLGKNFEWQEISPIPEPSIFICCFYSALVFVTFGAFLYKIKFYKSLHFLTVRILGDWKLYKDTKKFIWTLLILIMYFFIVPKIIDFLNTIISIAYNLLSLVLYLFPLLGISLILFFLIHIFVKKLTHTRR